MTTLVLYHNPRCSKSREALSLLESSGLRPEILRYLETPPDAKTLDRILRALGKEPRELMRKQEAPYKELNLGDPGLSREALIQAMVENPVLIERPILLNGDRAALGRPPEAVLAIL